MEKWSGNPIRVTDAIFPLAALFFLFFVFSPVLGVPSLDYYFSDRANFLESRQHTQIVTFTDGTLNVTIPTGFNLTSYSAGALVLGSHVSWASPGASSTVTYTMSSPSSCTELSTYSSDLYLDGSLSGSFGFICMNDNKISDFLFENGHGNANYFYSTSEGGYGYLPNSKTVIFDLLRVFNINQYFNSVSPATGVSTSCRVQNNRIVTTGRISSMNCSGSYCDLNFFFDEVDSYWWRIGVVSQEITLGVGDKYWINCTDLKYNLTHSQVIARMGDYSLEGRNGNPFNITVLQYTYPNNTITYLVQNIEKYPVSDIELNWKLNDKSVPRSLVSLSPNETSKYVLYLSGNGNLTLDITYTPSWETNSRNPIRSRQSIANPIYVTALPGDIVTVEDKVSTDVYGTLLGIESRMNSEFSASIEPHIRWYPNTVMTMSIAASDGVESIDPDAISVTVYKPSGNTYFSMSYNASNPATSRIEKGHYLFKYDVDSYVTVGVYEAAMSVTYRGSTKVFTKQFEISKGIFDLSLSIRNTPVLPGTALNFDVKIRNRGTYTQDVKIDYWYLRGNETINLNSMQVAANSMLEDVYSVSMIIPYNETLGWRTLGANLSHIPFDPTLDPAQASTQFEINSLPVQIVQIPAPGGSSSGGGGSGYSAPSSSGAVSYFAIQPERGKLSISQYPTYIDAEQDELMFQTITVKNTGNATLHDVKLALEGMDLSWFSVNPGKVSELAAGSEQTFIMKIKPLADAAAKKYILMLRAVSDESIDEASSVFELIEKTKFTSIRVLDIVVPKLYADERSNITIDLENIGDKAVYVSTYLMTPEDWLVSKNEINVTMPPKSRRTVEFSLLAPRVGTHRLTLVGNYLSTSFLKDIYVNVERKEAISQPVVAPGVAFRMPALPWKYIAAVFALLFFTAARWIYNRRKQSRSERSQKFIMSNIKEKIRGAPLKQGDNGK